MVKSKRRGRSLCLPWATTGSCPYIVVVALVVLSTAGGVWAQRTARQGAGGLMGSIPAESLFCVRINKIDDSLGAVNAYLKGIAPESFDAKAMVFSKLGHLLGDEKLRGVNRNGNFALFAVTIPGDSQKGPMGNLFIGALLPVRNYDNFISRNPNCGQPDEAGISTITVDSKPQALVTRFRRFALLCPPPFGEKLPQAKKILAQRKRSLVNNLDDNAKKLATSASVWVYLNVKQGAPLIKPMLFGKLEQIKSELQKAKDSGQAPMMIDPSGVISFYGGIFKMLLEGTDRIAVALSPSSESCNFTFSLKPLPGTEMADIVGQELGGNFDPMLSYLEDGAMMNIAGKVDHKSLITAYTKFLDLFGKMIPDSISENDLQALKELTTETINAIGDSLAITGKVDSEGSGPFRAKYIIEVKDKEAFEQVLDKSLKMMEDGVFNRLYKGFGIEMDVEINRDTGTYKGNSIGEALVKFKMGEDESMQGQMMAKMFGEGLEYRWTFAEKYFVYTIGADADQTLRALTDQIRAGGPKGTSSEIKATMDAMPDSSRADVIGTFNYARMLNMVLDLMVPVSDTEAPKPNITSQSNIAFSGRTTNGIMTFQMALPKSHLQDIKTAFETIIPEIEKQHQQQMEK